MVAALIEHVSSCGYESYGFLVCSRWFCERVCPCTVVGVHVAFGTSLWACVVWMSYFGGHDFAVRKQEFRVWVWYICVAVEINALVLAVTVARCRWTCRCSSVHRGSVA